MKKWVTAIFIWYVLESDVWQTVCDSVWKMAIRIQMSNIVYANIGYTVEYLCANPHTFEQCKQPHTHDQVIYKYPIFNFMYEYECFAFLLRLSKTIFQMCLTLIRASVKNTTTMMGAIVIYRYSKLTHNRIIFVILLV